MVSHHFGAAAKMCSKLENYAYCKETALVPIFLFKEILIDIFRRINGNDE